MSAFRHRAILRMSHCDAAGVLFFPRLFELANEAYEELLREAGSPLAGHLPPEGRPLPVVHAEAEYHHPMRPGQEVELLVSLLAMGRTSFRLACEFRNREEHRLARVETVHVVLSGRTWSPTPIPDSLRGGLTSLLGDPSADG